MSRFSRPSASALGRFLQLGGTGARIAGNLLVQRITPGKARIDWQPVGELLGDALGQMKGPVLKLGQQASQWQDLLPEPISAALARLQNQVPSLPFAALEANLQRLYDGRLYDLFESIEPTPAAAASLGQVHRATAPDGRRLAVAFFARGGSDRPATIAQAARTIYDGFARTFLAPIAQPFTRSFGTESGSAN